MNPGPPALEASTLPLGYRGGGTAQMRRESFVFQNLIAYLILPSSTLSESVKLQNAVKSFGYNFCLGMLVLSDFDEE